MNKRRHNLRFVQFLIVINERIILLCYYILSDKNLIENSARLDVWHILHAYKAKWEVGVYIYTHLLAAVSFSMVRQPWFNRTAATGALIVGRSLGNGKHAFGVNERREKGRRRNGVGLFGSKGEGGENQWRGNGNRNGSVPWFSQFSEVRRRWKVSPSSLLSVLSQERLSTITLPVTF